MSTFGDCRYRQAIPLSSGGRLDINTNYGLRRGFLPQGHRRYSPLRQPTAQEVMTRTISAGPTTVFIIGAHTNFAVFLMSNPQLKKNIEHIFVMGGGVRSKNPTGCCPKNASSACTPQQCGDRGNLFTAYTNNPYAEFNIFGDPFAAYQVFHSGIPITLVPLDATNTIPIGESFFEAFQKNQATYEAQYCFKSLKMARDTWFDDQFYSSYFMWDSFTSGVAVSIMLNGQGSNGENEFAEMEFINLTVVTSNEPYGVYDGSNPFFDGRATPRFGLQKGGVHSGHVQTGIRDPFCLPDNGVGKGKCQDGYTKEISGPEGVRVLVAQKAKPNKDKDSPLDREYFISFLEDLNLPSQSGRFNLTTQFPCYKEILYKADLRDRSSGRPVVFDMDMSAGDFVSLIYLLKIPAEIVDLKGILVTANGWATAATIDVIYDVLHMMGRDDIPVGLGSVSPLEKPSYSCEYVRHIPQGSGGVLDADTLFGLARDLPRSPRRYTAENSVKYGAPRDTDHPELRQPLATEVWESVSEEVYSKLGKKITVLTNGPLTTLANIIRSDKNATSRIQSVFIVGGHIVGDDEKRGNVFTVPSNRYSEFNFFLDPLAAETIVESGLDVTLIPLGAQRKVNSFPSALRELEAAHSTPELSFVLSLLSTMNQLRQKSHRYRHVDTFLGEVLGAAVVAGDPILRAVLETKPVRVLAGDESKDGRISTVGIGGKPVKILKSLDSQGYYAHLARTMGDKEQSAVIGSFSEQRRRWSKAPCET
ncbi:unnamed protein product [Spirodela intermedia]|uniref:Inosine/uridine-preferring nucleoside hydrolase domain-containing protein n=1 Tax=Spirodela intermedia TaxID=51605 RepID=A0A7I8I924_SPIIN|nr:unnamed protein product [Spirodela intermedia]CAA6654177.1 unnamed protein product [Spirodela intermedia]